MNASHNIELHPPFAVESFLLELSQSCKFIRSSLDESYIELNNLYTDMNIPSPQCIDTPWSRNVSLRNKYSSLHNVEESHGTHLNLTYVPVCFFFPGVILRSSFGSKSEMREPYNTNLQSLLCEQWVLTPSPTLTLSLPLDSCLSQQGHTDILGNSIFHLFSLKSSGELWITVYFHWPNCFVPLRM